MIPVAQYVRMSSGDQKYSIANQTAAISEFSTHHGFRIVKTYADPARSGLHLKRRAGLQSLLRDVTGQGVPYKAVLVYDVSRWGRFQDDDEAACYEFLCRKFGVKVIYCEESFPNDGSTVSSILKTLSRVDAREFSRELSVKVFESHSRVTKQGFWVSGCAPYGYARKLISEEDPTRNRILKLYDRKGISKDKVILVPASRKEVSTVGTIYRLALKRNRCCDIVRYLNENGFDHRGAAWNTCAVSMILKSPLYIGCNVWRKTTRKIGCKPRKLNPAEWIVTPGSFKPIVTPKDYHKVQRILRRRQNDATWKDEEIVAALCALYKKHGTLSVSILERTPGMPAYSTIQSHFGSFANACERVGHKAPRNMARRIATFHRQRSLRNQVIDRILSMFPKQITVSGLVFRPQLHIENCLTISIHFPLYIQSVRAITWRVFGLEREQNMPVLVCRRNPDDNQIQFFLFRKFEFQGYRMKKINDAWWSGAQKLDDLSELFRSVHRFTAS